MSISERSSVGASDAVANFSTILQRVETGEEITITRDGSPVARLVPMRPIVSAERRREAITAMRQLASRNRLASLRVKDMIAEGRK